MNNDLKGRTLIVTGASLGIGRALALGLAAEGVNLVLNARGAGALEEVARECIKSGVKAEWTAGTAASGEIARRLVEKALAIGGFNGFIHAAGVLRPGPLIWELTDEGFREIFEASVEAAFQMARAAFPHLSGGGLAVFFGSGAAEMTAPGLGAYCAAKAAEEHFSRQLAAEAPWVTTFAFRPGVVDTRMARETTHSEGGASEQLSRMFRGYFDRGELLAPEVPAKALISILKNNPRRFHGATANWSDGV